MEARQGRGAPAAAAVIGREHELERIRDVLLDDGPGAATILIEGEAGAGKTAVWGAALASAREAGLRLLVASPAETEAIVAGAALADLLAPVADAAAGIQEGSRTVLEGLLAPSPQAPDTSELAVSRAVLDTLRALAVDPLVIAIDDAHWLDAASARALDYAIRRCGDLRVRIMLTRRPGEGRQSVPGAAPGVERHVVQLPPLGPAAVDELLRNRLGLTLTRPALLDLARSCGGNPLFALEIGKAIAAGDRDRLPRSLADALAQRLSRLPRGSRPVVLLAAASIFRQVDEIELAAGGPGGLVAAIEQDVLAVDGSRLRFSHPLLASVAYARALPSERRAAHRRLAEVARDPAERVLHLARGHDRPDSGIAAELEAAAAVAATHGNAAIAAEAATAAAELTPDDQREARTRRLFVAAGHHETAGDPARGRAIVEGLIAESPAGIDRARLKVWLANRLDAPMDACISLAEQALAEAGGEPALESDIHNLLHVFTRIAGDLQQALRHVREAARFGEESGEEMPLAMALAAACELEALLGLPWDRAAMARALDLERRLPDIPPWERPSYQLALISLVTDELATARRLFIDELERARRLGSEPGVFNIMVRLAEVERRSGAWSEALRLAREAYALARQGGIELEEATAGTQLAWVLAHLGALDEARGLASAAHEVADRLSHLGLRLRSAGALGFIELSVGDAPRALEWLTPARRELERIGQGELSMSGVVQNEIEALLADGQIEEAERAIAFVERAGQSTSRAWNRAVVARGRALVAAARREDARATEQIAVALAAQAEVPQPFELARTLLAAGQIERRAKHWAAARERLTAALELFDELGAARWAEQAAVALARLPGRRPGTADLTETEREVARLAADGLANREIATRLFVSVRTVEANLTRAYSKLGVRSRAQLGRRLEP